MLGAQPEDRAQRPQHRTLAAGLGQQRAIDPQRQAALLCWAQPAQMRLDRRQQRVAFAGQAHESLRPMNGMTTVIVPDLSCVCCREPALLPMLPLGYLPLSALGAGRRVGDEGFLRRAGPQMKDVVMIVIWTRLRTSRA